MNQIEGFPRTSDAKLMDLHAQSVRERLHRINEDIAVADTVLKLHRPIKALLTADAPSSSLSEVQAMMWKGEI